MKFGTQELFSHSFQDAESFSAKNLSPLPDFSFLFLVSWFCIWSRLEAYELSVWELCRELPAWGTLSL